jgi:hypothetical protein
MPTDNVLMSPLESLNMTKDICSAALKGKTGLARFVHFLSSKSYGIYKETKRRRSKNDSSSAGRRVPSFLDSIGLSHLRRKHFLSMYVITEFTELGSLRRSAGYGEGSKCAIELPISAFSGRELYVFNGDVQNLAAPRARRPAYVKFEGDISALLSTISAWCNELPDGRNRPTFICEARLIGALTPALDPLFHGCPDPMGDNEDELSTAVEEILLGDED